MSERYSIEVDVRLVTGEWQGYICLAIGYWVGSNYPWEVVLPDDTVERFSHVGVVTL